MPKTAVALRPGEVKETVTRERVISADEIERAPGYGMCAFAYMASLTESDWLDHIL
jgi:hypothetical protein